MVPSDLRDIQQRAGVTSVLSLQHDECLAHFSIDYCEMAREGRNLGLEMVRVPIRDFDPADTRKRLPDAVRALAGLQADGHQTYVHCTAGISRAPLTVFGYLTLVEGMARDRALRLVLEGRPESTPYWEAYDGARADLIVEHGAEIELRAAEIQRCSPSPEGPAARARAEADVLRAVLSGDGSLSDGAGRG